MSSERTRARRPYIDWARGLAVILMIEAHTLDAWTRPAAKHSAGFMKALILGGFAAPLFLWLAGVATTLSAARLAGKLRSRPAAVEAVCRRGLEIFILAFLFRLQAFLVSPGSYPVTLFRVDILNIMGPAIAIVGLLWWLSARSATLAVGYAVAATIVAMVTPIVRIATVIDSLPMWLQWYVRPFGDLTNFTFFPWIGFVFGGAANGVLLAAAQNDRAARRLHAAIAAIGFALAGVGLYASTLPSIYQQASFWSSSPTWFAIRAGVLMMGLSAVHGVEAVTARSGYVCRPLERFGQSSLFVYWIHVELVYGYFSWWWRGRLPLWATLAAFAAFCALMYGAVVLKEQLTKRWSASARRRSAAGVIAPSTAN